MLTAVNAPFSDMSMNVGTIKYGLAHLAAENPRYMEFLGRSKEYTILDNGADELGKGMDGYDYMSLISTIRPEEVILPDILGETDATIEASMKFYQDHLLKMKPVGGCGPSYEKPRVMAVAQGKTFDEWQRCYNTWETLDYVDVIGIPYDIDFEIPFVKNDPSWSRTKKRANNRFHLVTSLLYSNLHKKRIHLLGMNNLEELARYKSLPREQSRLIRSNDTTGPFAAAIDGKEWTSWDFEKDWAPLDFEHKWTDETKRRATVNLFEYARATDDFMLAFNLGRAYRREYERSQ